jgi:Ca2+-binding EF-hand superfamily protein
MEQRYRRFAESMLRQYDTNKNGVLDRDEWSSTRPDLKAADRNGDGAITCDEMTAWLVEYSQRGSSWQRPSNASSGAAGGSGASPAGGSGPRKFYRALTATERLPEGLPEWFARKDANADGQISMAEFSGSWSEQAAAEFSNYDLNNDGIITPAECLGAAKR